MEKKRTTRNRSYNLYCINFHGSSLDAIKDEFKRQVKTGLRRTVFLMDLNDIQDEYRRRTLRKESLENRRSARKSSKSDATEGNRKSLRKESKTLDKNPKSLQRESKKLDDSKNSPIIPATYLLQAIQKSIEMFWNEYDDITKRLQEELKFDLYEYFLKYIKEKPKQVGGISKRGSFSKKNTASPISAKSKRDKPKRKSLLSPNEQPIECVPLIVREHNRVGQPEMVSKKKYILDDPTLDKLYIIIIGDMNEHFYLNLLRYNLPLQGIIHFVPTESKYDQLLGNNKMYNFIMETLGKIGLEVYHERQEPTLKPTGIFTHNIPVISNCMAEWYARDIFDQLSWGVYDIEVLHQQYQTYYVSPFQETDVSLPANVSLQDLYVKATTLIVQGRHQKTEPPASACDLSTIVFYLDSLLGASTFTPDVLSELNIHALAAGIRLPALHSNLSLITGIEDAFKSVTKLRKKQRLFVEEANQFFTSLLLYVDQYMFKDIYRSCLDYHALRPYLKGDNLLQNIPCMPFTAEAMILPGVVKFYSTDDSCSQRLTQLVEEYDDYRMEDLGENNRLYTFRRPMNTVIETEGLTVIPTCLCFRDFTLFQMQEFLQDLVTPQMREESRSLQSSTEGNDSHLSKTPIELNDNIFIRPKSLKALRLIEPRKERDKYATSCELREPRTSRPKSIQPGESNGDSNVETNVESNVEFNVESNAESNGDSNVESTNGITEDVVGLPTDHHLLKGYNLEDIRQEIRVKTTKYYFSQGFLRLYEDFWCFTDLNKTLLLTINNTEIYFQRPKSLLLGLGISPDIRLITGDNISIRILNEPHECSKVIMQYPNGLSIHYRDTCAEQEWLQESTANNEHKRVMTPYGCVVVFYKSGDLIMILRNNGEVYCLYQYEWPGSEEFAEEEDIFSGLMTQSSRKLDKSGSRMSKDGKKVNQRNTQSQDRVRLKSSVIGDEEEVTMKTRLSKEQVTNRLKMSIENELNYLNAICHYYQLIFLHLVLTTANGRVIHLTYNGKIYEKEQLSSEEWHDYVLDEICVERVDGVKRIWCPDKMKCYHKDGTILITQYNEDFIQNEDEFDGLISKSSSHRGLGEEDLNEEIPISTINVGECAEEHTTELIEKDFVTFNFYSCLMQHEYYADVYIYWPVDATTNYVEVYGVGNIRLFLEKQYIPAMSEDVPTLGSYSKAASEGEEAEESNGVCTIVNVWLGDDLHISVGDMSMDIHAKMNCLIGEMEEQADVILSDYLLLTVEFMEDVTDVFRYLVDRISTIQINKEARTDELYFIEKILPDCTTKGFEFMESLPTKGTYKHYGTNCLMVVEKFKNVHHLMNHKHVLYDRDMEKFPRFRITKPEKAVDTFPWVLSASVYCKVPEYLRNSEHIHKFIEPLEGVHFKKLRRKMKDFLEQQLNPEIAYMVRVFWSTRNWRLKRLAHKRRLFEQQQRLALYIAMLKHKIYPKYFKFMHENRGQVRNIEFFDFVLGKCVNKIVPKEEVYFEKCEKRIIKQKDKKCRRRSKSRSSTKTITYA